MSGRWSWVTASPKPHEQTHNSINYWASELKVVISQLSDFAFAEQQAANMPQAKRSLQPEWNTPDSYQLVHQYVLNHPEWRISLQTHKFTHIR